MNTEERNEALADAQQTLSMFNSKNYDNKLQQYGRVYAFTNESLKDYLPLFDLKGKNVLTVSASGDQPLNMLLGGAEHITAFDVNKLTYYWLQFKKAGILTMSLDEFDDFIQNQVFYSRIEKKKYMKLRDAMPEKPSVFWDELLKECPDMLFKFFKTCSGSSQNNAYLEPQNYKKLQKKLCKNNIDFINSDIKDLPEKLHGDYDAMFLSNIPVYAFSNRIKDEYFEFIEGKLLKHLAPNGIIQADYAWSSSNGMKEYKEAEESGKYSSMKIKLKDFMINNVNTECIATIEHAKI